MLFLMFFSCVYAFAGVNAQKVTLSQRNVPIKEVLNSIARETGIIFWYDNGLTELDRNVSISVKEAPITQVLDRLLNRTRLTYTQIDKTIVIKRKAEPGPTGAAIPKRSPVKSAAASVMLREVSGKVTDEKGEGLPGVNVVLKGTTTGTSTDINGKYTISFEEGGAPVVLSFSFVGYVSQEVTVGAQTSINIQLVTDSKSLDELVVVGYGVQKKRDVTGAIVSVSEGNFTQGPNQNAAQLINGRAPGVNVSQASSAPGGATRVRVRGANSINGNNDVLYVIDGLPSVSIADLSPEDITSIEVLKDASASAIYGTRAANGVILITTKTGGKDKSELRYSGYYGIQSVAKRIDVLNGNQYMNLLNDLRAAAGREPVYSADEIARVGAGTNWQDEIFRNSAPVQNHQLSMSGGTEKGNYYVGLNYFNQQGLVKESQFKKFNLRTNVSFKPKSFIDFKLNANFTRGVNNQILVSNAANEAAGPINTAIQFDPTLPAGLDQSGKYYLNNFIALDNPLALIDGVDMVDVRNAFYGTLSTDIHFSKDLTGTIRVGGDVLSTQGSYYNNRMTINGKSSGGIGSKSGSEQNHWLSEFLLNYNKKLGKAHQLGLMAGTTFEQFGTAGLSASNRGFLSDVTGSDLLQSGDNLNGDAVSSDRSRNRLHSILGRANYSINDRYLLTASVRVDGTSRFAENHKYAVFPSLALAWRVSDEAFFRGLSRTVSDLKLRAGYGKLGNQGIQNYETLQTLVSGGSAIFGNSISQGVIPARLPNANLRWETTSEYNIGLDYGLFGNRIYGSIEYYVRKTNDQLFNKPLPAVVGYSSIRVNFGQVRNSGFDFGLNSVNIRRKGLEWTSMLSVSTLKNEVTQLPDFIPQVLTGTLGSFISNYMIVQKGSAMQSYYGYQIDGIFQNEAEIKESAQPGAKPGEPRFRDQNGDNVINTNDQVVLGNPFPKLTFGLNNHVAYKGFTLDVFVQAVSGIHTLNGNMAETLLPTNEYRNRLAEVALNRWTPENPSTKYPSGVNAANYFSGRIVNSLTVQNASFFRLKNVVLGYNVPLKSNPAISKVNVYAAMDNIFTATKMIGFDPDANATGGVTKANYNDYPLNRTLRLGVNVTF
ncbi:TonB-linked SusC/RagA family outer membrane protein [Dyadobacter jiangsuensis]|uniref:TonB-linked SusC/RagA family outer membrane protein n=2 Tax=Dyadobacter jiangsuensis TaxID=1591085 RepID=A0A2P8FAX7_9BACT|nr:TonB-linked SusC/RagA family outer membrane protein [Dyadobacter jiangsuensis]